MATQNNKANKATPATPAPAAPAAPGSRLANLASAALLAPAALNLPPSNVTASPAKGRTVCVGGVVGQTYGIAVTAPGTGAAGAPATTVLPYQLPGWVGAIGTGVTMVLASTAPNWLGRNGHPLHCTVYHSPLGTVVVQPHAKGVQVNAYPNGHGVGITVSKLAPVAQAAAAPAPAPATGGVQ